MKRIFLMLALTLAIFLSGCGITDTPMHSNQKEMTAAVTSPSEGGYIYYSDGSTLRRMKADGHGDEGFSDFYSEFCFTSGEWVYYKKPEGDDDLGTVFRIKEDRTGEQQITQHPVRWIRLYGQKIYYTYDSSVEDGLFRADLDGGSEEKLLDDHIAFFYILYDMILYKSGDLNRCCINGGESFTIAEGHIFSPLCFTEFNYDGEYVYHISDLSGDYLDNQYLYRVRPDGTDERQLTDIRTDDFIISGDYIYYTAGDGTLGDTYIYKMKRDGSGKKKISQKHLSSSNLTYDGSFIYFTMFDGYGCDFDWECGCSRGFYEKSRYYKLKCDK